MVSNVKDIKRVKVEFERNEKDNNSVTAKILWEPEEDLKDAKAFVELTDKKNSEKELKRLNGSNIWCANYEVSNCFPEVIDFDKSVAIKLVEYKVKPVRGVN